MTVDELKAALDHLPKDGAINKAKRRQIQQQINELTQKGDKDDRRKETR